VDGQAVHAPVSEVAVAVAAGGCSGSSEAVGTIVEGSGSMFFSKRGYILFPNTTTDLLVTCW
jgi:hypothetical protein